MDQVKRVCIRYLYLRSSLVKLFFYLLSRCASLSHCDSMHSLLRAFLFVFSANMCVYFYCCFLGFNVKCLVINGKSDPHQEDFLRRKLAPRLFQIQSKELKRSAKSFRQLIRKLFKWRLCNNVPNIFPQHTFNIALRCKCFVINRTRNLLEQFI